MSTTTEPLDRLLSWREVSRLVPLSRVAVWALRRKGAFPPALQVSPNRIGWRESQIREFLNSRRIA